MDSNPVRAGIASTPGESDDISIRHWIEQRGKHTASVLMDFMVSNGREQNAKGETPAQGHDSMATLPLSLTEYPRLLDWGVVCWGRTSMEPWIRRHRLFWIDWDMVKHNGYRTLDRKPPSDRRHGRLHRPYGNSVRLLVNIGCVNEITPPDPPSPITA
ncbi:MAG: hypothetical protein GKR95_15900 [Gammaproteobacteria bacterium]|nr:hypothetical protein [Gammaproteobacteria bacterium]